MTFFNTINVSPVGSVFSENKGLTFITLSTFPLPVAFFLQNQGLTLLTFPLWEAKNASGRGHVSNEDFPIRCLMMQCSQRETERDRDRERKEREGEKER